MLRTVAFFFSNLLKLKITTTVLEFLILFKFINAHMTACLLHSQTVHGSVTRAEFSTSSTKFGTRAIANMKLITIPPFSVFVAHRHFQHAGAVCSGHHSLEYHLYFVPDRYESHSSEANKLANTPSAEDGYDVGDDTTNEEGTDNQ